MQPRLQACLHDEMNTPASWSNTFSASWQMALTMATVWTWRNKRTWFWGVMGFLQLGQLRVSLSRQDVLFFAP